MRRIVLIDGENLTYGLRTMLGSELEKAARTVINNFNFRGMLEELLEDNLPSEILWFGARLQRYSYTPELLQKSIRSIRIQAQFMNAVQAQKISFIKVGNLKARETDACAECGHQTWRLAEKGVDVGLAVRMLTEAQNPDTELVIVSADTDLIPAFKAAKKLGAKLMHIGYENRPIVALSRESDVTRTITLPLVKKYLQASMEKIAEDEAKAEEVSEENN